MKVKTVRNTKGEIAISIVSEYYKKRGYMVGLTPQLKGSDLVVWNIGKKESPMYLLVRAYDKMKYFDAFMISPVLYKHCMRLYTKTHDPLRMCIVDHVSETLRMIPINKNLMRAFQSHPNSDRFLKLDFFMTSHLSDLTNSEVALLKKYTSTTDQYK